MGESFLFFYSFSIYGFGYIFSKGVKGGVYGLEILQISEELGSP